MAHARELTTRPYIRGGLCPDVGRSMSVKPVISRTVVTGGGCANIDASRCDHPRGGDVTARRVGGPDRQLALGACQLSSLLCIIAPRSPTNLRNPTPSDTPGPIYQLLLSCIVGHYCNAGSTFRTSTLFSGLRRFVYSSCAEGCGSPGGANAAVSCICIVTSPPLGRRSIVMTVSACVCVFVRLQAHL